MHGARASATIAMRSGVEQRTEMGGGDDEFERQMPA
jgi:hypothetical protein